ncbi:MAG: hypothetical protein R3D26_04130 [Cyanobacteriota/Melainabacteria group bacterium]
MSSNSQVEGAECLLFVNLTPTAAGEGGSGQTGRTGDHRKSINRAVNSCFMDEASLALRLVRKLVLL